jgi:predicted nucleic acid-binding protein
VIRAETKYVLDTNLFIDAFRDQSTNIELQGFHEAFAPFEYLSSVVVQELRAGARSGEDLRKLERKSGDVLARLAQTERLNLGSVTKAFGNDILLALSCREVGMTLVTRNTRDFARIQRVVPFRFVAPWPPPAR